MKPGIARSLNLIVHEPETHCKMDMLQPDANQLCFPAEVNSKSQDERKRPG